MKSFLEEYGFAILAAIVVILLIAMCTPVGNLIKNQVMGVVESFAGKTEAKLAAADADAAIQVVIKQKEKATASDGDVYSLTATSDSTTDALKYQYRFKDQNGNWTAWSPEAAIANDPEKPSKDHAVDVTLAAINNQTVQDGNAVQFRVFDPGKADGLYYESNIVIHKAA